MKSIVEKWGMEMVLSSHSVLSCSVVILALLGIAQCTNPWSSGTGKWFWLCCSLLLAVSKCTAGGTFRTLDTEPSPSPSARNSNFESTRQLGAKRYHPGAREDGAPEAALTWMKMGSADVSLRWTLDLPEGEAGGFSVQVGENTWTVMRDHPFYTVPRLKSGRSYSATISPVPSLNTTALQFTFTTPAVLPEEMITKIQEEMKQKSCGDGVKIEQVSFSAQFGGIQELAMVLEVSDLSSKKPLQWVEVAGGSSSVFLSGLPPDTLLQLTLKTMQSREPMAWRDLLVRTVHTGGCMEPNIHNLTRTLGLDLFFPTRGVSSSSKWNVRCYADDEVFFGFPCRHSDLCVPLNWMCDKEDDCPDGDDEDECGLSSFYGSGYCRKHEFRCVKRREHVCLPISYLCDGRKDCTDGWDEEPRNCRRYFSHSGALNYHGSSCRSSYFRCRNQLGCVAPTFVCDGEDDCSDGSDEWNCGSDDDCDSYNEFQCFRSYGKKRCIPRTWMCDDQEDCARGEDEDFDVCRDVL